MMPDLKTTVPLASMVHQDAGAPSRPLAADAPCRGQQREACRCTMHVRVWEADKQAHLQPGSSGAAGCTARCGGSAPLALPP